MSFSALNEFIAAIFIGIIQGLTEFLPISSTAHLDLFSRLFLSGRDFGLSTSNIIQFGTTIALLIYFKEDLKPLIHQLKNILTNNREFKNWLSDTKLWWQTKTDNLFQDINPRLDLEAKRKGYSDKVKQNLLLSQLAIATVPIAILGLFLQKYVDSSLRGPGFVAIFLSLGAGLLMLSENLSHKFKRTTNEGDQHQNHDSSEINPLSMSRDQVILIGLFQSMAIFPGMSRSGSTIAGSLIVGLNRPQAARFAFLVGIPALFLSSLKDLFDILSKNISRLHFLPEAKYWDKLTVPDPRVEFSLAAIAVAMILSFIFGYISLKWLIKYISKVNTAKFSYYRFGLSFVILMYLLLASIFKF
jgi:undecaprenyl-diphosphatase